MFKNLAIILALFLAANAISLRHQDDSDDYEPIDFSSLDQDQKDADAFFRRKIPNLRNSQLVKQDTDDEQYRYQYMGNTAPLQITEAIAERVDDEDGQPRFKLIQVIQNTSGPLQQGRMVSSRKTYGIESFGKAKENLDWF